MPGGREEGIRQLAELATAQRVAIICGEPLPWRCHRLLIANTLAARAWTVWHVIGSREPRLHQLGRWGAAPSIDARGRLTYPSSAGPDVSSQAATSDVPLLPGQFGRAHGIWRGHPRLSHRRRCRRRKTANYRV
ncbi:MAG: DUF488 family protein [Streptosporangiaceae bacterium]